MRPNFGIEDQFAMHLSRYASQLLTQLPMQPLLAALAVSREPVIRTHSDLTNPLGLL